MSTKKYRYVGYGDRVGGSFKGIIGGLIAIIAAVGILWWNEGNSVKNLKTVKEGRDKVVEVSAKSVDPNNQGGLIHIAGFMNTEDTLVNDDYGFSANAIKFEKVVEMYQYKEEKTTEKLSSSEYVDTYTYKEVWSTDLIDSDKFEESWRSNPKEFYHEGEELSADLVSLEAFELGDGLIAKVGGYSDFEIEEDMYYDSTGASFVHKDMIYYGYDTKYPEIGDERVFFKMVEPQDVSIIAKQMNETLTAYTAKNIKPIELIEVGLMDAEAMFILEDKKNSAMRWIFRFVGFFLMFAGFAALLKPISAVMSGLPLIGNVLEEGAAALTGIVAFLVALALTLIIIGIAWVFYRPFLGIALLLAAFGSILITKKFAEPPAIKEKIVQ